MTEEKIGRRFINICVFSSYMVLDMKLREWYHDDNPITCYVAYFVHLCRNALHSKDKKYLTDSLDKLLTELREDNDVSPEHQIRFACVIANFSAQDAVRKWSSKKNYSQEVQKAYEHAEKRIRETIGSF
jgi:hypothetical protein